MSDDIKSFFSVSFDLIPTDEIIKYDLYVNSSSLEDKEKFVRVFPQGELLKSDFLSEFKAKYPQLYVPEKQRSMYLESLMRIEHLPDSKKAEVLKNSAIKQLNKLFSVDKEKISTEYLKEIVEGSRETVEYMIDVVQDYSVKDLQALIGDLSFHDFYTYDHSINVSMYCISIYKTIKPNASRKELLEIGLGGLLHDMGKILIPTDILNNPGKLTEDQFKIIKTHPGNGEKILDEHRIEVDGVDLETVKGVITQHHENFDGSGYPNKLAGENIHYFARIAAIADFFDAVTTKRTYAEPLSVDEAVSVMDKSSGKKLDPTLFNKFVKNVQKLVLKGRPGLEMDESFDPSVPYEKLPFKKVEAKKQPFDLSGKSSITIKKKDS